jgi:hypothetical protein
VSALETQVRALPLKGGCLCGAVRYEVRGAPFLLTACHCLNCQKRTGSAYSMNLTVRREDFAITEGAPAEIEQVSPSGTPTTQLHCGACYARLASLPSRLPHTASVRPGTLDDTGWLKPVLHIFARSALPGAIPAGAATHETAPDDFSPHVAAFGRFWNEG